MAITIETEIITGISQYLVANYTTTSIQHPNTELDTNSLDRYIAWYVLPVLSKQMRIGCSFANGEGQTNNYLLDIQIFINKGIGMGYVAEICDTLKTILNQKTIITTNYRIEFLVPSGITGVPNISQTRAQFNLSVPFEVHT